MFKELIADWERKSIILYGITVRILLNGAEMESDILMQLDK